MPGAVARRRLLVTTKNELPFVPLGMLINAITSEDYRDPLNRLLGDPLDPHRHDAARLRRIFHNVGPRQTASLWQQTPRPSEGSLFNREFFKDKMIDRENLPRDLKWCRFWDWAYSEEQVNKGDPDWTVGAKVAFKYDQTYETFEIFLGGIVRARKSWSGVKRLVAMTAEMDSAGTYIAGEANGPQKGACNDILHMSSMAPYVFGGFPTQLDKVAKAQPWMDRARESMMWVVRGEWNEAFFDEGEAFPNGSHDDIIDAISGAYIMCAGRSQDFDMTTTKEQVMQRW
jgi:predicted phage terminase large subunit-like protein